MKTKLTLSIDQNLVEFARARAAADNTSISGMFSAYLSHHKMEERKATVPTINAMRGSLKQYAINDSKRALRAAYAKKHSD